MIANCGVLGLDWRSASLSDYVEALIAHNDAQPKPDGEGKRKVEVSDELRRFMAARS
ncbi:MAG: hypothetical protein V4530_06090 [Pseudomonadota bacterium]